MDDTRNRSVGAPDGHEWLPYVFDEDGAELPSSIRYLASDNTSLLWYKDSNGAGDRFTDHGLNAAYEKALRLPHPDGGEEHEDALVSFIDTLTDNPAMDLLGTQELLAFPLRQSRDIADDQYILADRRLRSLPTQQDSEGDVNDGTEDDQARYALRCNGKGAYVKCTTNLAGILYNKDSKGRQVQLSISSRFSKDDSGPVPIWKDWFLAYMVQRVLHVNLLDLDFANDPDGAWCELLMWVFPAYLNSAIGKGIYRKYMWRRHNDARPRGRIDVARHIRENTPFAGTVAYSRRVFDEDNPVTELVRHTIEHITEKGSLGASILNNDVETVRNVREIRRITARYNHHERRDVIAENQRHPVRHALYQDYLELQKLCISILTGRGLNPQSASDTGVHGIIFDCAWLWEEYLNTVMSGCRFSLAHPRNKDKSGKYHLLTRVTGTASKAGGERAYGRRIGEIYPDFIISDGPLSEARLIADAKYKPEGNIGGSDYSQVIAYMRRFRVERGLYLYPFLPKDDTEDEALHLTRMRLLDGSGPERQDRWQDDWLLTKLGLNVSLPNRSIRGRRIRYEDYASLMRAREQDLVAAVSDAVGLG